jgi:hypothetical protein
VICEPCQKRGWVAHPTRTAVECPVCHGKGEISSWGLAKKLGERPETLARVRDMRSKQKTCMRVLEKIAKLMWPKQKELFT